MAHLVRSPSLFASMAALAVALVFSPVHARAAAPEPRAAVPLASYEGRWFELARTPNRLQRNCLNGEVVYELEAEQVRATHSCVRANGGERVIRSSGRILDPGRNAKVKLYFYGFWSQEYWIIDRNEAEGWAIVTDPKGKYVWLMARAPRLAADTLNRAVQRVGALGYDVSRLEFRKG